MIGQVSHQVTVYYPSGAANAVLLEGSQDGVNWSVLAQILFNAGQTTPGVMVANGYYQVLRLAVNPGSATVAAIKGVYAGFQSPLPASNVVTQFLATGITAAQIVGFNGSWFPPYLVSGFQCSNPNAATAWLELYDSTVGATLGVTTYEYEVGIPAGNTFVYPGSVSFLGVGALWVGAATAQGGTTPVGTGLSCDFQLSYSGPFAPFTPLP